ncbi:MAG: GTP 3',8-cyclase MoaA [Rhodospirillales bacterium]|nr:MAG: GTP 3',8-cyclase MoaA [Rhodospirillales bacterium]
MHDAFNRRIDYLRVSVTDRCDLRCTYCMTDTARFVPRSDVLSLEEIERLCSVFLRLGVGKLRITGGEPLVRRNILWLFERLGGRLGLDLDEMTLTTNATRLDEFAQGLAAAGVRRVNVSLDTLSPETFKSVTRQGDLGRVLKGIKAGAEAGLKIKINCVLMKGVNDHEIANLLAWCHGKGFDLVLIETMPMGDARSDRYLPIDTALSGLSQHFTLIESNQRTNGPARYLDVRETGGRLGLITPLSHNFCEDCNRVRLSAAGKLYLCLGHEDGVDLKCLLRGGAEDAKIEAAILQALAVKPRGHDFVAGGTVSAGPGAVRAMSATGG